MIVGWDRPFTQKSKQKSSNKYTCIKICTTTVHKQYQKPNVKLRKKICAVYDKGPISLTYKDFLPISRKS